MKVISQKGEADMTEYGFSDFRHIILLGMLLTAYLAFPGVSVNLWKGIKDGMALRKANKLFRKKRQREELLKKYWEIDMRNLK